MSIREKIAELEGDKKLFCLESELTGEDTARILWVSEEVYDALRKPYPKHKATRLAEFRRFLDGFLELGRFSVAEDPDRKPSHAMLARVKPVEKEFWGFRVTAPKDGIRALGAFADRDVFVLLTWEYREDISDFDAEVRRCMDEWKQLFGAIQPLKKGHLHEYLSEYIAV